ncbi:MAG: ABC transporter ATP-binding protein [Anaerovoracaceae bacterium]|jgi:iron complex transport system ATP-binding protein
MKLELRNVACGYNKKAILNNINFEVETGEICCLLGPNGVGKTTLFKTILKLMKPLEGKVVIDGEDIAHWHPSKLARYMAYVSQYHVPPFPYIVKDVVLLGRISSVGYFGQPTEKDYAICDRAMEDMGISHLKEKVYTDISGGERQLVMIARALAQEPQMLVLDEPTASLDYGNMVRVMGKIKQLQDMGHGVIMTTHSPDQAFMCDSKVVLLQRNAPVKFGSTVDVITEKNLKEAYGVDVNVVEFPGRNGKIIRVCAPEF